MTATATTEFRLGYKGLQTLIAVTQARLDELYAERHDHLIGRYGLAQPDPELSRWREAPEIRRTFVGGSDLAAIVGEHPTQTNVDVYLDKTALGPVVDDFADTELAYWGNANEPAIIAAFAARHPWLTVVPTRGTWRHPTLPFIAASPDALIFGDRAGGRCGFDDCGACKPKADTSPDDVGLFEAKNVTEWLADDWDDGYDCPDRFVVQALSNCEVVGGSWSIVAGLVGGNKLRSYVFEHRPALAAALHSKAALFWDHVESREAPPIQLAHAHAAASLQRLYTADPGTVRELEGDARQASLDLGALVAEAKAADAKVEVAKNTIRQAMGTATEATIDGVTVATWRPARALDDSLVPLHIWALFATPTLDKVAARRHDKAAMDAAMTVTDTRKFLPKQGRT